MAGIVGSPGAINVTSGATANTPAWGTGETQTAGNLGILLLAGTASSATVTIPAVTNWTNAVSVGVATNGAAIYFRALTGGDVAPTVPSTTNVSWKASLAEFTGLVNTATDQHGSTSTGTTAATAASGAADAAAGELIVAVASSHFSAARTITDTFALTNNGAPAITQQNNDSTSAAHHTSQGYTFGTTSNAAADSITYTPSATATSLIVLLASFQLSAVIASLPDLVMAPPMR